MGRVRTPKAEVEEGQDATPGLADPWLQVSGQPVGPLGRVNFFRLISLVKATT
jgi:hypothetical protein